MSALENIITIVKLVGLTYAKQEFYHALPSFTWGLVGPHKGGNDLVCSPCKRDRPPGINAKLLVLIKQP